MTTRSPAALGEYLNDHLAGSQMAIALLGRLRRRYARQALGAFFTALAYDIEADQQALMRVARAVGRGPHPIKRAAGAIAEVLTRPKLRLRRNGALGLFQSLEVLALGIHGKRLLWRALQQIAAFDRRLDTIDLVRLEGRASAQYERVEHRRLLLARQALAARHHETVPRAVWAWLGWPSRSTAMAAAAAMATAALVASRRAATARSSG